MDVAATRNIVDAKRCLTDVLLVSAGLCTVDDDNETIPWYMPLSRLQKDRIKMVTPYGYKVGLL
jgi:hypothetical protein